MQWADAADFLDQRCYGFFDVGIPGFLRILGVLHGQWVCQTAELFRYFTQPLRFCNGIDVLLAQVLCVRGIGILCLFCLCGSSVCSLLRSSGIGCGLGSVFLLLLFDLRSSTAALRHTPDRTNRSEQAGLIYGLSVFLESFRAC